MKKVVVVISIFAAVIGIALPTFGNITNTIPYDISFETNEVGTSIIDTNLSFGWYGDITTLAMVTNFDYSGKLQEPVVTYPLNSATHSNVLVFNNGTISNGFVANNTLNNVYVDVMIQPVPMEEPALNEAISNSQVSAFVTTQGFLRVWHGVDADSDGTQDGVQWSTLSEGVDPIGTDKWVRLTITMDYLTDSDGYNRKFFQVQLNGHVFTNALAFNSRVDVGDGNRTGTWFMCANQANNWLSLLSLSGSGMFDDMVVTDTQPSIDPALQFAALGTPYSWLALWGWTSNQNFWETNDTDGDGALAWQEYVEGTVPTNPNSVLKITAESPGGGSNALTWLSTTNALYPYSIQYSTNLVEGKWQLLQNNIGKVEGTTTYGFPLPSQDAVFYRITVTN
jgi:hypothetical protein